MDNKFELDLTLLSKELKLLLELLKDENEESIQKNKQELFSDIDWEHFLYLTRHHRVYPLMYVRLKNMEENIVPKQVIEALYKEYKRNTFQMLQLSAEMKRVSNLFMGNGIHLLFLKGPVIAYDIYEDISLRTSKDLDILIEEKNLKKAEELLFSLGYKKEGAQTILNERKWRGHHILYYHSKMGMQIELHWRMQPFPMKEPSFNELWKLKRTSSLIGSQIYFLREEDLFVYLVSHGASHGWFRLRWLKDLDKMLRKEIDFEKIYVLLKRYKCYFAGGQVLILASELLQTPVNGKMQGIMKEKRSGRLANMAYLHMREGKSILPSRNYLRLLKTTSQKILSIVLLFYPTFVDTTIVKLPKSLHFLYFPLRPFLWTWRKTKQLISS